MITEQQIQLIIQRLIDEKESIKNLVKIGYQSEDFGYAYTQGINAAIFELKFLL